MNTKNGWLGGGFGIEYSVLRIETGCLAGSVVGLFVGWFVCWLVGLFVGWLISN